MVDRKRNARVCDLIEQGYNNEYIARRVGETAANVGVMKKRLKEMGKEKFIQNYRVQHERMYFKEKPLPQKQTPRYKIGDIVQEHFEIIQIYELKNIMYLTQHILHKYKKCFFDDDLRGGSDTYEYEYEEEQDY